MHCSRRRTKASGTLIGGLGATLIEPIRVTSRLSGSAWRDATWSPRCARAGRVPYLRIVATWLKYCLLIFPLHYIILETTTDINNLRDVDYCVPNITQNGWHKLDAVVKNLSGKYLERPVSCIGPKKEMMMMKSLHILSVVSVNMAGLYVMSQKRD